MYWKEMLDQSMSRVIYNYSYEEGQGSGYSIFVCSFLDIK